MIEVIDSSHIEEIEYGHKKMVYIDGLITVKVRYNIPKYSNVKSKNGILVLKHWKWINVNQDKKDENGKDLPYKSKLVIALDERGNQIEERFKRLIVGSGHNRGKKALFIREDLFEKINKILLGGMDELANINGYPMYKKGYAKWNSYYGLASTDSKVVKHVPKIVVVKDFKRSVEDTFDTVIQTKKYGQKQNPKWKEGDDEKDKYLDEVDKTKIEKDYKVKNNDKRQYNPDGGGIMPFDGAGLVSVECAKQWAKELNIKNERGKKYIPAAFQIRVIPGIKGNLYTFDIEAFARENGWIITDNKGRLHDYREERIDIILTESQTKFIGMFDDDIDIWRKIFDEPVKFEDGTEYKRTFNISEYSDDADDLKHRMLTAYQHWQTVENTDEERKSVIVDTTNMLKKISIDVNEFLKYRSCTDDMEENFKRDWKRIPPYYRAAYYADKKNKSIIFADSYFKKKVAEDIKGAINRALSGKLYISGNYQVLTPDIYGLAQYAFGKRGNEVTGLLHAEEIYSNWWLTKDKIEKEKHNNENGSDIKDSTCDELALIRNPHIYMEARVATVVSDKDKERFELIKKWYRYQNTGILTDSYSTIPLALGTADFDGDHIASTNCKEYISAVKRARKEGKGNTIDWRCDDQTKEEKISEPVDISNIQKLMEFDILAYQNNIGTVIDKVTTLWGIADDSVRDYIKIMNIIGQLTIDAAKTGEFEDIPKNIKVFLKKHLKPYFMKYLQKNWNKRKAEADAIENAEFFFDDEKINEKQLKFSSDATNLNKMCWLMEESIVDIQNKVDEMEFSVEDFLKVFCTEKPNITSDLYIRIREKLEELTEQHATIYSCFKDCSSDEEREERTSHYRYFYICAREELLHLCKLSEERSINKVLNCIVYMCYTNKKLVDNDGAKNILWNCFEDEMIDRAKQNYEDKELDFSGIEEKVEKIKNLKARKLTKCLSEKPLYIKELEDNEKVYNPILIDEGIIENINGLLSADMLKEKNISLEYQEQLKQLYAVLIVISKRLESKRKVGKNKIEKLCVNSFTIKKSSNNALNYSSLAKLCGFSEYHRKCLKDRLKELQILGAIRINSSNLSDIKIHVNYDNTGCCNEEDSIVDVDDYKNACCDILQQLIA